MTNQKWDLNKYKYEHELEHHWELKKRFMLAHYDKFPEQQLVSLAQTFYNVEVLGCTYDAAVMKKLKSLSSGMCNDRVSKEKTKFDKGFVPASNAANERVKAKLGTATVEIHDKDAAKKPSEFVKAGNLSTVRGEKRPFGEDPPGRKQFKTDIISDKPWLRTINPDEVMARGPFAQAVVFQYAEDHPEPILQRTASASKMILNYTYIPNNQGVSCKVQINGLFLALAEGPNQKTAKAEASELALKRLKQTSFTVMVKHSFVGNEVNKGTFEGKSSKTELDVPISSDNIGSKMLKLMGWSGGGLGKDSEGIKEPIGLNERKITRQGLGANNLETFTRKAKNILLDFKNSDSREDLVFSPDFSVEERKVIHEMVRKFNLKSKSYGKDSNRHMVVFKKIDPIDIVKDLIECGGETEKYVLIPPSSYLE